MMPSMRINNPQTDGSFEHFRASTVTQPSVGIGWWWIVAVPFFGILFHKRIRTMAGCCGNLFSRIKEVIFRTTTIAVCGEAASGKSNLIRALNRIAQSNRNLPRFVEMPGTGRLGGSSADNYFRANKLNKYNKVLLLTGAALREEELSIAEQVQRYGKSCAFVRSKCDRDLIQNADDEGTAVTQDIKDKFLYSVHQSYGMEMQRYGEQHGALRDVRCFAISALSPENFPHSGNMELDEEIFLEFVFGKNWSKL